jgi:tetratricopeptide (TPR) repeat protein
MPPLARVLPRTLACVALLSAWPAPAAARPLCQTADTADTAAVAAAEDTAPQGPAGLGLDPAAQALTEAVEAYDAGQHGVALRAIETALAEVSDGYDAELILWQARILAALKRHSEALDAFERLALSNRGRSAAVRIEHARVLRAAARQRDAWAMLDTVLDNYPRCGPARLELIDLLVEEGQLVRAEQELDLLLVQAPDVPFGLVLKARLLTKAGEGPAALELLRAHLDRDDQRQSLRAALVELLLDAGRAREAWLESKALLSGQPGADYLELCAAAASAAGEHLDALSAYSRSLAKDPSRESALEGLLYLFERAPDVRDAIALTQAQAAPDNQQGWIRVLRGRIEAGRSAEAFELYQKLPEALQMAPEVKLEAVLALRRAGRLEEGLTLVLPLCPASSTSTPEGPRAWYERGMLEFEQQRLVEAERSFELAAYGPLKAEALFNRALLQIRAQRYAEAARTMEIAVVERPNLAAAWLELGHLYRLYLGDRAHAEECYRTYLQLVGRDAEIEALLGGGR